MAHWWRIHLQCRKAAFDPWVGKIPWRRKWQPTPVFLPGKSHGERNLAGYSPWVTKSQTWLSYWAHAHILKSVQPLWEYIRSLLTIAHVYFRSLAPGGTYCPRCCWWDVAVMKDWKRMGLPGYRRFRVAMWTVDCRNFNLHYTLSVKTIKGLKYNS